MNGRDGHPAFKHEMEPEFFKKSGVARMHWTNDHASCILCLS